MDSAFYGQDRPYGRDGRCREKQQVCLEIKEGASEEVSRFPVFSATQSVFRVLYVIPRIVSATFLFREWVVHSSEEKEKVADAKYCATV